MCISSSTNSWRKTLEIQGVKIGQVAELVGVGNDADVLHASVGNVQSYDTTRAAIGRGIDDARLTIHAASTGHYIGEVRVHVGGLCFRDQAKAQ